MLSSFSLSISLQNKNIMRMSCNGCRVLRKGCSENCVLRPCLQWIQSPESQANATVFLAKFYGRAGLLNLINAGPHHLRPAIFRSLLHEACGRIINPIYGSVGLMWSGNWEQCQAAVDSVLNGSPIMQIPSNNHEAAAAPNPIMPLKGCDIRHLSKDPSSGSHRLPNRKRCKKSGGGTHAETTVADVNCIDERAKFSISGWKFEEQEGNQAPSHDSSSVETVEASLINRFDPVWDRGMKWESYDRDFGDENSEALLELTLG